MRYAICVALGIALAIACFCGWWILDGSVQQGRVLADLERTRGELVGAQTSLADSTRQLGEARRGLEALTIETGQLRKALEGSQTELGILRGQLSRGQELVGSSAKGIDRLREIIQGLPKIGPP